LKETPQLLQHLGWRTFFCSRRSSASHTFSIGLRTDRRLASPS
jgi:hypothetical protein